MTNPTNGVLISTLPAEVLIFLFAGALITVELLRKVATNVERMRLREAVKQALVIVSIVLLFATAGAALVLGYSVMREWMKPVPPTIIHTPEVKPEAEPATQSVPPCQRRPRRKKKAAPPVALPEPVVPQPLVQKSLPPQEAEWKASSKPPAPSSSSSAAGPEEAAPAPEAPATLPPADPELT